MSTTANITWSFVPGSLSTLVEYRLSGDTIWITPSSPDNPTITNTYSLVIENNVYYDVRLTTNGISCGPKATTIQIISSLGCCPPGYTMSGDETYCYQINTTAATPPSSPENTVAKPFAGYGTWGTLIYDIGYNINGTGTFTQISFANTFWVNGSGYPNLSGTTGNGPLNRSALWSITELTPQTIGYSACITLDEPGTYYVGAAADNYSSIYLDGNLLLQMDPVAMSTFLAANGYPLATTYPTESTFRFWHIYPVQLQAGTQVLEIIGTNTGSIAAMGAEIYSASAAEIISATSYVDLGSDLIFSTKDVIGDPVQSGSDGIGYSCPVGYSLVLCDGPAYCTQTLTTATIPCSTTTSTTTTTTTTI